LESFNLDKLQSKLAYSFKDQTLLRTALTHSSYANEKKDAGFPSNERFEFLGDSVLGMMVAELIFRLYPDMAEGRMTRLRAELVCEKSLTDLARELELGSFLLLGRGEEKGGGRNRPSILADAFEAVIASMYLDGGFVPAAELISKMLGPKASCGGSDSTDYKTALQEIIQEIPGRSLTYHIIDESGPDHQKVFTVEVCLNGAVIGLGSGSNKKEAEQAAAKAGLEGLTRNQKNT